MLSAEFQAKVQNGQIQIPENLQQEFEGVEAVKVILIKLIAADQKPLKKPENRQRDIFDELRENPISVEGFVPLSRDEAHDRRL